MEYLYFMLLQNDYKTMELAMTKTKSELENIIQWSFNSIFEGFSSNNIRNNKRNQSMNGISNLIRYLFGHIFTHSNQSVSLVDYAKPRNSFFGRAIKQCFFLLSTVFPHKIHIYFRNLKSINQKYFYNSICALIYA